MLILYKFFLKYEGVGGVGWGGAGGVEGQIDLPPSSPRKNCLQKAQPY